VDPRDTETEYVGWNACHRSLVHASDGTEILLRLGIRAQDKGKIATFGKLIPSLILSGPPGVSVTGGVPKTQDVVSYWPALMAKDIVSPKIALIEGGTLTEERIIKTTLTGQFSPREEKCDEATVAQRSMAQVLEGQRLAGTLPLAAICLARSGDKGDTANIGVIARSPLAYEFLRETLSAQVVKDWFQELCHGRVKRYAVPKLSGFNFLLESSLGGGGTRTLRVDAQGKTFAQGILRQRLLIPAEVIKDVERHQK